MANVFDFAVELDIGLGTCMPADGHCDEAKFGALPSGPAMPAVVQLLGTFDVKGVFIQHRCLRGRRR